MINFVSSTLYWITAFLPRIEILIFVSCDDNHFNLQICASNDAFANINEKLTSIFDNVNGSFARADKEINLKFDWEKSQKNVAEII